MAIIAENVVKVVLSIVYPIVEVDSSNDPIISADVNRDSFSH